MITIGRVAFVRHRGERVLQIDYSGLREVEELESVAREASECMAGEPAGSVLALADLSEVPLALRWARRLGKMAIANAPRVRARAIVGLPPGGEQALAELGLLSGTAMRAFRDREAALDWLATQARAV